MKFGFKFSSLVKIIIDFLNNFFTGMGHSQGWFRISETWNYRCCSYGSNLDSSSPTRIRNRVRTQIGNWRRPIPLGIGPQWQSLVQAGNHSGVSGRNLLDLSGKYVFFTKCFYWRSVWFFPWNQFHEKIFVKMISRKNSYYTGPSLVSPCLII